MVAPRSYWLSDRGVLKLMAWAFALTLVVGGVRTGLGAGQYSHEVPGEPIGEPECMPPTEPDGVGVCSQDVGPSTFVTEPMAYLVQALAALQVLAGILLLWYQAVRWSPARVQAWLPAAEPKPAGPQAEGAPAEPWRDL